MMQEEKQGAEREAEAKAIAAQRKADLEHLIKNVHPSLRGSISLGDASDGTTQALGDYAAVILREEIESLKTINEVMSAIVKDLSEDLNATKEKLEALRLQVFADATPETPSAETFAAVPGIGAKAEEFAPTQAPTPAPVIEMPAPTPTAAVVENGVTVLQEKAAADAAKTNL